MNRQELRDKVVHGDVVGQTDGSCAHAGGGSQATRRGKAGGEEALRGQIRRGAETLYMKKGRQKRNGDKKRSGLETL